MCCLSILAQRWINSIACASISPVPLIQAYIYGWWQLAMLETLTDEPMIDGVDAQGGEGKAAAAEAEEADEVGW